MTYEAVLKARFRQIVERLVGRIPNANPRAQRLQTELQHAIYAAESQIHTGTPEREAVRAAAVHMEKRLADLMAQDAGAVATTRGGRVRLVRDSWAHKRGLVKADAGFVEGVGTQYMTRLHELPDALLTREGQEWVRCH